MNFKELGIREEVCDALIGMDITEPTEIQAKVMPDIIKGADIIGVSKTGSGKTIAFSAPMLNNIKSGAGIQALVVSPTRELAEQTSKEIQKISKATKISTTVIYGGVSLQPQADNLRRADIVVGTPGRLLDHLARGSLKLSGIKVLVLDECDKMVSMGFIDDVEKILKATPKNRQTLLFGATVSHEIAKIRDRYMNSPTVIKAESHVNDTLLNQYYYDVDKKEKFSLLVHLIKKENPKLAMIFCSTRKNAEIVSNNLKDQKLDALFIHGGLSQHSRLRVIEGFHKGRPEILVATAVAARGLDIKGVTHIFNYDVPKDPEEYIHQIGRTARAGESGKAITLLSDSDHQNFSSILRKYPVKITKLPKESFFKVAFNARNSMPERRDHGRPNFRGRGNNNNNRRHFR